jgi:cation:H+ antiporter
MSPLVAIGAFAVGVIVVVVATEYLLRGLVGVAAAMRVAPFVASVVLSGLEAENIAVGLAAGARSDADVALGTAYGGAVFALSFALGLGAIIAPLRVTVPKRILILLPASAVVAGLPILFPATPRWTGLVLLAAFGLALVYLVRGARGRTFVAGREEADEDEAPRSIGRALALTAAGIGVITIGGELVAVGADGLIGTLGLGAGLVGMVITPIAIEAEEIVRQVLPTRRGYADVAAGNTIGTVLWFILFNLGLIALITPVGVPDRVRSFDWPALVLTASVGAVLLARGRIGRAEGAFLALLGILFAVAHLNT